MLENKPQKLQKQALFFHFKEKKRQTLILFFL